MTASLTTVETKCFPTLIVSMKMLILFSSMVRFVSVTACSKYFNRKQTVLYGDTGFCYIHVEGCISR